MLDTLIYGGTVIDGTGNVGYRASVGITGDVLSVHHGDVSEFEAARKINASGYVVSPGFIDLHTHSDNSILIDKLADSKLTQGVTFELLGTCGMSYCAPLNANTLDGFKQRTDRYAPEFNPDWSTMDGYLNALEKSGSTINLAAQIGHGTVQ